jgi:hypothetical protein
LLFSVEYLFWGSSLGTCKTIGSCVFYKKDYVGFINFIGRIWVIIDAVHLPEQKKKTQRRNKRKY